MSEDADEVIEVQLPAVLRGAFLLTDKLKKRVLVVKSVPPPSFERAMQERSPGVVMFAKTEGGSFPLLIPNVVAPPSTEWVDPESENP